VIRPDGPGNRPARVESLAGQANEGEPASLLRDLRSTGSQNMETVMETTAEADHGHRQHEVTFHIAVNGQAKEWHHHKISYEEVVKLAFPDGPTGGDVRYSVSWTKPHGEEGSLRPGQSVHVVDRMSFDVRNTDKS
jgi:hypothetical protein